MAPNCWKLAPSHAVDLVILDLDMPVMDGLTAAEELAERGIPAVLVSGHPDVQEVVLEHEPVVTRVMKPATIDKLRDAIRVALSATLILDSHH